MNAILTVMMPPRNDQFAAWIKARLGERGVLPSQAAVSMGVPPSTVDRWLEGVTPRRPSIGKIAGYFKRPEDEVLTAAGYRQPTGRQSQIERLEAQITTLQQQMADSSEAAKRTLAENQRQTAILGELLEAVRQLSREETSSEDKPRLLGREGDRLPSESSVPG